MKRIICLLLAAALCLCLFAACAKEEEPAEDQETVSDTQDTAPETTEEPEETQEPSEEDTKAQQEEVLQGFLEKLDQLNAAMDELDMATVLEMLDQLEADLDAMDPDTYAMVEAETTDEDGVTLRENLVSWRDIVNQVCIHNTAILQPAYVITASNMGSALVNDGGEFAAYNTYFDDKDACKQGFAQYKEYISQFGTITEEDDESFKLTDEAGNELEVRMSLYSKAGTVQVRIPSFTEE